MSIPGSYFIIIVSFCIINFNAFQKLKPNLRQRKFRKNWETPRKRSKWQRT